MLNLRYSTSIILAILLLMPLTVTINSQTYGNPVKDPILRWWDQDSSIFHNGEIPSPPHSHLILGPLFFDPASLREEDIIGEYSRNLWIIVLKDSVNSEKSLDKIMDGYDLRDVIAPLTVLVHSRGTDPRYDEELNDIASTIIPYHPMMKLSGSLYEVIQERDGEGSIDLAIGLYELDKDLLNELNSISLSGTRPMGYPHILLGEFNLADVLGIASHDSVSHVSLMSFDGPDNDVAADIIDVIEVWEETELNGSGQIVAVVDSGLDTGKNNTMHADISGRIVAAYAYGRTNDWSDKDIHTWTGSSWDYDGGHGTHVVGSAVGNGSASNGNYSGMAPNAELVIQSRMTSTGSYKSIAYSTMFRDSYVNGARIQTNSWSSRSSYGNYTWRSWQTDYYIWKHPDFTVLFSAGNNGKTVGNHSISTQASSKNVIAVGASESYRPSHSNSDNISQMADFSSQGYTWGDNRIKPDVVAPGTWILSMRSSLITDFWNHYWGSNSTYSGINSKYAFMGGTSMSTPIVAGMAALIRQYYEDEEDLDNPSAALVKATVINGARPLNGDWSSIPNRYEGWGRVNLSNSLATKDGDSGTLTFYDNDTGLKNNEKHSRMVSVSSGKTDMIATLVWTDYPGSNQSSTKLVNDLDLKIETPDGKVFNGNDFLSPYNDTRDSKNNVERIRIPTPEPGIYRVNVSANSVTVAPQDYALVISGDIARAVGNLEWDSTLYNADGGKANLTLMDSNLSGSGWIELKVNTSSDPEGEMINLTEYKQGGTGTGVFFGQVKLTMGTPGTGEIKATSDDIMRVFYDEDYPKRTLISSAQILIPPVIDYVAHDATHKILTYQDQVVVTINGTKGYSGSFTVLNLSEIGTIEARDDGVSPDLQYGDGNYTGTFLVPNYVNNTFFIRGYIKRPKLEQVQLDSNIPISINTNIPRMPRNLSVTPLPEGNRLSIQWVGPGDVNLMNYSVYRANETSPGSGKPGKFELIHSTPDNRTHYTDPDLVDGNRYFYSLSSFNVLGFSSRLTPFVSAVPEDIKPPSLTITSPSEKERIGGIVTVNVTGDSDLVRIILEGATDRNSNGVPDSSWEVLVNDTTPEDNITWDTTNLPDPIEEGGVILLRVLGYDEAGNQNLSSMVTGLIIDNTPPDGITLLSESRISLSVPIYNLVLETEPESILVVERNGESLKRTVVPENGKLNVYLDLVEGLNIISLDVYDSTGNGPVSYPGFLYVVYDNVVPVPSIEVEEAINSRPVVLNGSGSVDPGPVSELTGIDTYRWFISSLDGDRTLFGETVEVEITRPGYINANLTVIDRAGNSGSTDIAIDIMDDITPELYSHKDVVVFEDDTLELIHPGYSDNDPDIRDTGVSIWNITGPENFKITGWDAALVLSTPGNYICELILTDADGNRGNTTFSIYVKDITPPDVIIDIDDSAIAGEPVNLTGDLTTDNHPDFPLGAKFTWKLSSESERFNGIDLTYIPKSPGMIKVELFVQDAGGNQGSDELELDVTNDGVPPRIISSYPGKDWKNASPDLKIELIFNEPMNTDESLLSGVQLEDLQGSISLYHGHWIDEVTLQIEPDSALVPGTTYDLVIAGLLDRSHTPIDPYDIQFTVRPNPRIIGIEVNGLFHGEGTISVSSLPSVITLKFDHPIVVEGVSLVKDGRAFEVDWVEVKNGIEINLMEGLEDGVYRMDLASPQGADGGVVDLDRDLMIRVDSGGGGSSIGGEPDDDSMPVIPLIALGLLVLLIIAVLAISLIMRRKVKKGIEAAYEGNENLQGEMENPPHFEGNNKKP